MQDMQCYRCGTFGHFARDCPLQQSDGMGPSAPAQRPTRFPCRRCGSMEHWTRDCPGPAPNIPPEPVLKSCGVNQVGDDGAASGDVYLQLTINGQLVDCLLDSGSEVTLLPESLCKGMELKPTDKVLVAANGTSIEVLGTVRLLAQLQKVKLDVSGFVSPHVTEVMLGMTG